MVLNSPHLTIADGYDGNTINNVHTMQQYGVDVYTCNEMARRAIARPCNLPTTKAIQSSSKHHQNIIKDHQRSHQTGFDGNRVIQWSYKGHTGSYKLPKKKPETLEQLFI